MVYRLKAKLLLLPVTTIMQGVRFTVPICKISTVQSSYDEFPTFKVPAVHISYSVKVSTLEVPTVQNSYGFKIIGGHLVRYPIGDIRLSLISELPISD
jgi:hypothetical protein